MPASLYVHVPNDAYSSNTTYIVASVQFMQLQIFAVLRKQHITHVYIQLPVAAELLEGAVDVAAVEVMGSEDESAAKRDNGFNLIKRSQTGSFH